jgi:hypothetical protein
MRAYRLIVFLAALIFVLTGIYIGVYEFYRQAADTTGLKAEFSITASALQKQFADDETGSSSKYINKILEVSGIVISVNEAEGNRKNIALKTDDAMSSVICTLQPNAAAQVKEGDRITIKGECSGYLMDVLLNNCVVVK